MVEYNKVNVKLWGTQLKKLKTRQKAVKKKQEQLWEWVLKSLMEMIYNMNCYWQQLLLKLRNAFNNNMSTDWKLFKAQFSKITQSEGFLGPLLSKLAGPFMKEANFFSKKCFSSLRNYSSCFSIWCRNSKENACLWNNNFNNFKWRNEWYNEHSSSSWIF